MTEISSPFASSPINDARYPWNNKAPPQRQGRMRRGIMETHSLTNKHICWWITTEIMADGRQVKMNPPSLTGSVEKSSGQRRFLGSHDSHISNLT